MRNELAVSAESLVALVRDAAVLAGFEQLLSRLFELPVLRGASRKSKRSFDEVTAGKWLVFSAEDGRGFAVAAPGPLIGREGLSAAASRVRLAARLAATAVNEDALRGLSMAEMWTPPEDWVRVHFHHEATTILLAHKGVELPTRPSRHSYRGPLQEFRLVADLGHVEIGTDGVCLLKSVRVASDALGAHGEITANDRGELVMELQISNGDVAETLASGGARICTSVELGVISLSCEELSALGPGSLIEIECGPKIPCSLKVAGKGLMSGVITQSDAGLVLTITEVIG